MPAYSTPHRQYSCFRLRWQQDTEGSALLPKRSSEQGSGWQACLSHRSGIATGLQHGRTAGAGRRTRREPVLRALAPMWGQRFSALPPAVTAAGAMSCAALMQLPSALIVERPWTLAPAPSNCSADRPRRVYGDLDDHLCPSGANPWGTWNHQRQLPSPGFSVALGILFLGESFGWSTFAGMALIVLGVVAVTATRTDAPTACRTRASRLRR